MIFAGTPFSLRPATSEDLASVLEIESRCYPRPWSMQAFEVELQKPFSSFLVLTDDETDTKIAGYIIYWVLFEECHILNVAVHPDWRGLGIATALIRNGIDAALRKDVKKVYLEVRTSNDGAIALYKKLGFYVDHAKKAFYEDGEDAYFMVLYLTTQSP